MRRSRDSRQRRPLYARLLRLRHLRPGGLVCFLLFEGSLALGVLLTLAELVDWWAIPALPAVVAFVVKVNDVAAGLSRRAVPGRSGMPLRTRLVPVPGEAGSGTKRDEPGAELVTPGVPTGRAIRLWPGYPARAGWVRGRVPREAVMRGLPAGEGTTDETARGAAPGETARGGMSGETAKGGTAGGTAEEGVGQGRIGRYGAGGPGGPPTGRPHPGANQRRFGHSA